MLHSEMPITLGQHEKAEWIRAAQALYARGENKPAHLLSACAAKGEVPVWQYDRASAAYRAWLVFNEPKPDEYDRQGLRSPVDDENDRQDEVEPAQTMRDLQ